jgi:oxygen-independent coproporphyrinogen-3 oxidase
VFCNAFPHRTSPEIQNRYVCSLADEIDIYSKSGILDGKKVRCIYLGGGTPSTFSNKDIGDILGKIKSHVELSEECNVTCEARPEDLVKKGRLEGLLDQGISRVSIGCQTFDSEVLKLCGRSNPGSQVSEVIREAGKLGISTNIDMMIGLPGQTLEGVRKDLDILSNIGPDSIEYMRHEIVNPLAISVYRRKPHLLVDDDELFWMVYHTQKWIEKKGYEQNGHFTGPKYFPYRYYWLKEIPFIAVGSRSRSYTATICYDKHEDLHLYSRLIEKGLPAIARYMLLNRKEQMYRSLFLSLQIKEGLSLKRFESRFGESALEVFAPLVRTLTQYGCIVADDSSIKLTRYGRYFVEDVCCFIMDRALEGSEYRSDLKRVPHSSGGSSIPSLED